MATAVEPGAEELSGPARILLRELARRNTRAHLADTRAAVRACGLTPSQGRAVLTELKAVGLVQLSPTGLSRVYNRSGLPIDGAGYEE